MIAAENGAIPGCKVGGIADVVQSLPPALAALGHQVTVITPGYGLKASNPQWLPLHTVTAMFGGLAVQGQVYEVKVEAGVRHLVLESPRISAVGIGKVYVNDGADRPFASDASRFALFSALVGSWLCAGAQAEFGVLHLHDWHAGPLAILRCFDPAYADLRRLKVVLTIHNLALQGIRPLTGDPSALHSWFPDLPLDPRIIDPRWTDCVNLMRAGIVLADAVNTVSPGYAREILAANDDARGRHGGEGLETDLQRLAGQGQLLGILNGVAYPEVLPGAQLPPETLLAACETQVQAWLAVAGANVPGHAQALATIAAWRHHKIDVLVTSIGRLTPQKVGLLMAPVAGRSALEELLVGLGADGLLILLGSGDADCEAFCVEVAQRHANFLYLRGFSAALADDLYRSGQLFLMPSSYEPCGISQLLAMRAGQPCVVHQVGGLADTVRHHQTGWCFAGADIPAQVHGLVSVFAEACAAVRLQTPSYLAISRACAAERFDWQVAASAYADFYQGLADR